MTGQYDQIMDLLDADHASSSRTVRRALQAYQLYEDMVPLTFYFSEMTTAAEKVAFVSLLSAAPKSAPESVEAPAAQPKKRGRPKNIEIPKNSDNFLEFPENIENSEKIEKIKKISDNFPYFLEFFEAMQKLPGISYKKIIEKYRIFFDLSFNGFIFPENSENCANLKNNPSIYSIFSYLLNNILLYNNIKLEKEEESIDRGVGEGKGEEDTVLNPAPQALPEVAAMPEPEAKPETKPEPVKRFVPPTLEQVAKYKAEAKLDHLDPAAFMDHYTSVRWRVGSHTMADWKAAARNWNRRQQERYGPIQHAPPTQAPPQAHNFDERKYDKAFLDKLLGP